MQGNGEDQVKGFRRGDLQRQKAGQGAIEVDLLAILEALNRQLQLAAISTGGIDFIERGKSLDAVEAEVRLTVKGLERRGATTAACLRQWGDSGLAAGAERLGPADRQVHRQSGQAGGNNRSARYDKSRPGCTIPLPDAILHQNSSRLRPVIAAGTGKSSRPRMVGARSARIPSRNWQSRRFSSTKSSGTRLLVWAV